MSVIAPTFSESWHRVAAVKTSLRPTVRSFKQSFRGERWYVLHDAFNNQFFRLRPAAYDFVARLRADRTVAEVWEDALKHDPEEAPGQEEVIRLLTQLHFANLLYYDTPSDSEQFFERYRQRKQRELQARLLSIMFVRLPLYDPDVLLQRIMPATRYVFTWIGALVWIGVVGMAIKVAVDHFDQVAAQAQGVLAPGNLFLLYLGMIVIKVLHEFGHSVTCRHFGGEVHVMGVMLLVFTPLPYMDATSSWAFRNRWERALVGAAGMITELFVAALAVFVWAGTGNGVIHSLAYNMMFVASVSTVVFNGNPLLKFDGYYILSDILDLPNLYNRSRQQWVHLSERYLFGVRESEAPAENRREAFWLSTYGALSGVYRVIVFTGIIVFVADKYLLLGFIMAVVLVVSWVFVPPYRLIKYLATSPRLDRTRLRAIGATVGILFLAFLLTAIIPVPNRFRVPGVVEAKEHLLVINDVEGIVEEVLKPTGVWVHTGDPLVRLSDFELDNLIRMLRAQREQVLAMEQWAGSQRISDLKTVRQRKAVIEAQLADLAEKKTALVVTAKQEGVWVAPRLEDRVGTWLPRGSQLGQIVDDRTFRFSAVVPQDEARNLFIDQIGESEVRLFGQSSVNLDVTNLQIIPYQAEQLPSASLSWVAGGEIATDRQDKTGRKASEPFFQIYGDIEPNKEVALFHGQGGRLRLTLADQPVMWQIERAVRQLLQKRYQL